MTKPAFWIFVRCALGITLLCGLPFAQAADEPVDMQRLRELRDRVQKGEKLSVEEQAVYDRGVEQRQVRQKQRGQTPAKQPSAPDDELKRARAPRCRR